MIRPVIRVVDNRIDELTGVLRRNASELTQKTADKIAGRVHASMEEPKHGRVYLRRGKAHQASAPGEAPAIDTRTLYNSYKVETLADGVTRAVYTDQAYGEVLELGGVHVAPRPALVPAANAEIPGFESAIAELLKGF